MEIIYTDLSSMWSFLTALQCIRECHASKKGVYDPIKNDNVVEIKPVVILFCMLCYYRDKFSKVYI